MCSRGIAVVVAVKQPCILNKDSATFDFTDGHHYASFAPLANIVLGVIIGDDAAVQNKPAWLPSCEIILIDKTVIIRELLLLRLNH